MHTQPTGRPVTRRTMSVTALTALAALTATATLPAAPAARGGRTAAQFDGPHAEQVRAREVAFAASMADRDFEAFRAFLAPDAVFFDGSRPLRGKEAIAARWARFFDGETAPFSWHPDTVQVLESGELALTSGPVLRASGEAIGRFNSIWRRDSDGVWRVVFDKGS